MATVLFVDDNQTFLECMTANLETALPGLRVLTAENCCDARTLALAHSPEVAVLDLLLPDGDGLALSRDLVQLVPEVRVILATAAPPAAGELAALGHGVTVLAKPYETAELVTKIRGVLGAAPDAHAATSIVDALERLEQRQPLPFDRHRVINRLHAILAGLRAFGADLVAEAHDADAVRRVVDDYLDRLVEAVLDVSQMLTPRDPSERSRDT